MFVLQGKIRSFEVSIRLRAGSTESRRDYGDVFERMRDVGATSVLHELRRRECASMADTDNADLRISVSVQEASDGLPIRTVSSRWDVRHLRKRRRRRCYVSGQGLRPRRFSDVRLGLLQWVRTWIFCGRDGFFQWSWFKGWFDFFFEFSIVLDMFGLVRTGDLCFALGVDWFWTISSVLFRRGMAWVSSGLTAAITLKKKKKKLRI